MDEQLRRAERDLTSGNPEVEERWLRYCARIGLFFRDHKRGEILSEWEESQQDYDEIWWHRKSIKSFKWTSYCRCCYDYGSKYANSRVKAKDMGIRNNWGDNNAKRKTLRTHRDGSRRNYRLRD